ncbi:MAG: TRAP transporter small permease subunit [Halofilum sp. (in: g-proteobacteria)]|nr:TRAP transporter small permease subunit [Halofilum sp. (in: g-proteobacteria)]
MADIIGPRRGRACRSAGMVDITQLCVMAMAFWAIPFAFVREGHVKITFATEWMPARARSAIDAVAALAGAALVVLIGRYGYEQALTALAYGDSSQTIGIPMIWYWAVRWPASAAATLVVALRHAAVALSPASAR